VTDSLTKSLEILFSERFPNGINKKDMKMKMDEIYFTRKYTPYLQSYNSTRTTLDAERFLKSVFDQQKNRFAVMIVLVARLIVLTCVDLDKFSLSKQNTQQKKKYDIL